jgi:ferredoxin
MARAPRSHRVTIANAGQTLDVRRDETILDAAVAAGIDHPYLCASGNCGTCIAQLDSGRVDMLPRSDASLAPEQAKAGKILSCRARPRSDVTVTWLARGRR